MKILHARGFNTPEFNAALFVAMVGEAAISRNQKVGAAFDKLVAKVRRNPVGRRLLDLHIKAARLARGPQEYNSYPTLFHCVGCVFDCLNVDHEEWTDRGDTWVAIALALRDAGEFVEVEKTVGFLLKENSMSPLYWNAEVVQAYEMFADDTGLTRTCGNIIGNIIIQEGETDDEIRSFMNAFEFRHVEGRA